MNFIQCVEDGKATVVRYLLAAWRENDYLLLERFLRAQLHPYPVEMASFVWEMAQRCSLWDRTPFTDFSALHVAARHGRAEIAIMLIDAGMDPNVTANGGFAPLHAAAQKDNVKMIGILVERGADLEARYTPPDGNSFTPLHAAAQAGQAAAVLALLSTGASHKALDAMGRTPFDIASFMLHNRTIMAKKVHRYRLARQILARAGDCLS